MLALLRRVSLRHLPEIFERYGRPVSLDDVSLSPVAGEAAFIGLSEGLIGARVGLWRGVLITDEVRGPSTGWSFPYIFPARLAVARGVASTLCAILSGLYPAHRAAALNGVEALA